MKKNVSRIYIYIYLFIFIYTPRLISKYNPCIFLLILSTTGLIFFYKKELLKIIKNKKILKFCIGMYITIMYLLFVGIFTNYLFSTIYRILTITLGIIPICIYICIYLRSNNYNFKDLCDILIKIAFFQSIICILMFINNDFRQTILNILIKNGLFTLFVDNNLLNYVFSQRIYGLATGYTFSMPVLQGFIAIMSLIMGIKYSSKYYIYIPFILFSVVINARTGVLVFIIGGILSVILVKKNILKKLFKVIVIVLFLVIGINMFGNIIKEKSPETFNWINIAKEETINFLLDKETVKKSTYNTLGDMVFFPKGSALFIGIGNNVFQNRYKGRTSDIGYINDIFTGGIIFIILFYGFIIQFGFYKKNNSLKRDISIVMIVILLFVNIKGRVFMQNEFFSVYLLLSIAMMMLERNGTIDG